MHLPHCTPASVGPWRRPWDLGLPSGLEMPAVALAPKAWGLLELLSLGFKKGIAVDRHIRVVGEGPGSLGHTVSCLVLTHHLGD